MSKQSKSYKTPGNTYSGFTGGTLQCVMPCRRIGAERYEIANAYKAAMARFPDGELLAAPFTFKGESPSQNPDADNYEETFLFFRSRDDGRTWEPSPTDRPIRGREACMQVLADGETLLMSCHWLGYDCKNPGKMEKYGLHRSLDRGRTWEDWWVEDDLRRLQPEAEVACAGRNVVELPNGDVLFGVSSFSYANVVPDYGREPIPCRNWLFRSPDKGKTWTDFHETTLVMDEPANFPLFQEAVFHRAPSGRLFLASRTEVEKGAPQKKGRPPLEGHEQGDHLRLFSVDTDSMTIREESELLDYGMLHPHFLNLPNGRILCTYTHRSFPFGTQAVFSSDDGHTWDVDAPVLLAWHSWNSSCGFPANALLPDGRVITAYTTRKLTGLKDPNRELFSEAVIWDPEAC